MTLSEQAFARAAQRLNCPVAVVKAVAAVESNGSGLRPDKFPKTLFEGHLFHKYTNGRYDSTHPTLSYPKWTSQFYGKSWVEEAQRLDTASKLDRNAALLSTSFGLFQILGANFAACGCSDLQQFVNRMCAGEDEQLDMFIEYVLFNHLDDELRSLRWADFARLYNGPGYAKNKYDTKLAAAYSKFAA